MNVGVPGGERGNVQTVFFLGGGVRVSTSVTLAMGPTEEEEEPRPHESAR